jgi:hypothetical protein
VAIQNLGQHGVLAIIGWIVPPADARFAKKLLRAPGNKVVSDAPGVPDLFYPQAQELPFQSDYNV